MRRIIIPLFATAAFLLAACSNGDSLSVDVEEQSCAAASLMSSSSGSLGQSSSSELYISYGTMVDERDGREYKTVAVGSQVWMMENLNYEAANSVCQYDSQDSCARYGRRYSWSVAMDSAGILSGNGRGCGYGPECSPAYPVQGICPHGWHLPSRPEWDTLFAAVENEYTVAYNLNTIIGWSGDFNGPRTCFYSSTETDGEVMYTMFLDKYKASIGYNLKDPRKAMQDGPDSCFVRCVMGVSSDQDASITKESPYGILVDDRDGQIYKTLRINKQIWMVENLNYAYLQPTSTLDSSSWCYENNLDDCKKYGRLYLWSAAVDSASVFSDDGKGCGFYDSNEDWHKCLDEKVRGVCPEGWHLPSYNEDLNLFYWSRHCSDSIDNDCEEFDNEMLYAGYLNTVDMKFWHQDYDPSLWLSSEKDSVQAFYDVFDRVNFYTYDEPKHSGSKQFARPVRCVKDYDFALFE